MEKQVPSLERKQNACILTDGAVLHVIVAQELILFAKTVIRKLYPHGKCFPECVCMS